MSATPLETVLEKLDGKKRNGSGWMARCPAHEDKRQSLAVSESPTGAALLHCHAGCTAEAVTTALGLALSDLFPPRETHPTIVATYDYHDETGKLLYQVCRMAPKDFRQRRPDGNGGWTWSLGDVRRVLYHLPELAEATAAGRVVFVVEGEKDVHALEALGFAASTNAGGAEKWRAEYSQALRDARVVILPDNDEPGRKHARQVVAALDGVAADVKVVELPDLPAKGDVSDWLAGGGTAQALKTIVRDAPLWQSSAQAPVGVLLSEVQPERVSWLWSGRLPLGKLTVLDGDPGKGKSTLTLDLAARLSRGDAMPDGSGGGTPAGVVILSGEDGLADTIVPRLIAAGADLSRVVALASCPDNEGDGEHPPVLPDDLPTIRAAIARVGAKLAIIDPLMAYLSDGTNSHRDQDIRRLLFRVAALAEETGAAVLVVRHLNKAAGGPALYRGGGSIGIIGAARSGLLVAADPDDENRRVLASTKLNLGPPPESLSFHLEADEGGAARVVWDGTSTHGANALLAQPATEEDRHAIDEAKDFLLSALADGPVNVKQVQGDAGRAGVSEATLRRAKTALEIVSEKQGMGGPWVWTLPKVATEARTYSLSGVDTSGDSGHLQEVEL